MRTSEQINEIATALAKAQGAIEGAVKGNINPHFKSKYADLGAVWDACRKHLSENGIAVIQPIVHLQHDGGGHFSRLVTRLIHTSGQWIEDGGVQLILSKDDMQGFGSAMTYSRRYGLMSMVGIAPEDDDGNAASAKPTQASAVQQEPAGFGAWWNGAQDAAIEGTDKIKQMWAGARPEYRQYVTKNFMAEWEALKARAAKHAAVPA